MIKITPLRPDDIPFLSDKSALYASDFRAISESMDYEIPAMWKYENALLPIVRAGTLAVNEHAEVNEGSPCTMLPVPTDTDPRVSIFRRLTSVLQHAPEKMWVAIPHPDADILAEKLGCPLQYAYQDFLRRNDKFRQKEVFGDQTPSWQILKGKEHLDRLRLDGYDGFIKRRFGSGGYTVFPISRTVGNESFDRLLNDPSQEWFIEKRGGGTSCSIQAVRFPDGTVTIFGYSEQKIVEESIFAGSLLRRLEEMETVRGQLESLVTRMGPLLEGYEGFFGIDFLRENDQVLALEANVRLTAATVPTLLFNCHEALTAEYHEDVPDADIQSDDIRLMRDAKACACDILRLSR